MLEKNKQPKLVILGILFLSAIFLYFLNFIPGITEVKNGFFSIIEPIASIGIQAGSAIRVGVSSISEIGRARQEIAELEISLAGKESEFAKSSLLIEEIVAMQSQLRLNNEDDNTLEAKVIASDNYTGGSYITLNKGKLDDVSEGDVVEVGNVFLGLITEVADHSSKVMLPRSSSASWQVKVVPDPEIDKVNIAEIEAIYNENKSLFVSGVITGKDQNVLLENIPGNYNLERGQAVITFDERIGDFYVVGYVGEMVSSSSESTKSAYVKPIFDYDHLRYVFIKI